VATAGPGRRPAAPWRRRAWRWSRGIACNTAGGSHHAQADTGAGFCVFNDVAVAARRLLEEGKVSQVLVVDLDVHQGDGTARIFTGEPSVFTFSMHAEKNFPARKAVSDLDVDLPDGTGDEAYLEKLGEILPDLLARVAPDLVFFNAGVDPHADDKLGRSEFERRGPGATRGVRPGLVSGKGIPVAGVIGGGYDADIDRLAHRHALLHRAAREALGAPERGREPGGATRRSLRSSRRANRRSRRGAAWPGRCWRNRRRRWSRRSWSWFPVGPARRPRPVIRGIGPRMVNTRYLCFMKRF
jgi:acetoin utilization deacetylase AcuC-like enzyme